MVDSPNSHRVPLESPYIRGPTKPQGSCCAVGSAAGLASRGCQGKMGAAQEASSAAQHQGGEVVLVKVYGDIGGFRKQGAPFRGSQE